MHSKDRTCAAVIIGSTAMTLSALAIGVVTHLGAPPSMVASTHMSLGSTSTATMAPEAPDLGVAQPAIKGPAPLPTEEQGLEGIEGRHH
jgi:hypothetical protein